MANIITIGRIVLVIPFILVFLSNTTWNMTAALVIFIIAALTDFLDGWVARARNEVSALGAALDPIADKLLVAAALLLLARNGLLHGAGVIGALVILLREILVGGLREALAARSQSLPVTPLAKGKTSAQLLAIALLLAAAPNGLIGEALRPIGVGVFWVAVILTFWTGADYTIKSLRLLRREQP